MRVPQLAGVVVFCALLGPACADPIPLLARSLILALDRQEANPVDRDALCHVGDHKQLLFDDAFFESHKGFWFRVCPPRKTGEHNVIADKPWESFVINGWHTVMEDEGRYRMWYEAYDKSYTSDFQARYCYAESKDGIHWKKPALGLETFNGSKENNILFNQLGGGPTHGGTVFKDPVAPSDERYRFIYLAGEGVGAGLSADGIHWRRYEGGHILKVGSDTQTVCFWDDRLRKYVAYCRLWTPNRSIGRSESEDFSHFPPAVEVLGCDGDDPRDTDMYNSAAIKYPYAGNAYFIFTSMYHHTVDNVDVQLAVSRDGVHWTRPERKPFIPNGEPGSLDDASVYAGVGLLRKGDELWMYYYGSRAKHNENYPKWISYGGTFSRAILTLDRYVAMDAGIVPAEFTTHPLTFTGSRLEINADVRPEGTVKVELQEAGGKPIHGFTLDECLPLSGNHVRHVVRWRGGPDLTALAGKPTKMRCVVRDASLFAFQFAK